MNDAKPIDMTYMAGKWMPSDHVTLEKWMKKMIDKEALNDQPLHPVIEKFQYFIEHTPSAFICFSQMFKEVPKNITESPANLPQIRDYKHMLRVMNVILTSAPEFNDSGLVGVPINALLNWSISTKDGWMGFLDEQVNRHLKSILNHWAVFLQSPKSTYVLSDDEEIGWLSKRAMAAMPSFINDFQCDPEKPHYGFHSWDDFFTRRLNPGARPIASPENDDVIINACESAPYRIAKDVKLVDKFWLKAQPYALRFMLADDPFTDLFVGGTIYQAYLSALTYHRWHAPVSGKIIKTKVIDGTYFSALTQFKDGAAPDESQAYITSTATRALIFIQADNPKIGLMCFMAVGMAEVSTCDVRVSVGQYVKKGDELGTFRFGGSTHCLIFRPEVELEFNLHGQTPGLDSHNILINSHIATVI